MAVLFGQEIHINRSPKRKIASVNVDDVKFLLESQVSPLHVVITCSSHLTVAVADTIVECWERAETQVLTTQKVRACEFIC